ncbi:class A beta-lactamase [Blastococcus goldschmidtiae]|uniref:Beta-lactamase n=1 Tax=Blastococcus goldschmidtiae TaxID=3075546 RepID=A0ABU2K8F4_9ACTN|nr:class A beta-lactamase [Blastococcus sp. DSM 46792]MDT0276470.1 class A beta-lactamase [Blastococcus sp. DSM 46792]
MSALRIRAGAVVLVALLGGCSGTEPVAAPPSSPSPSPSTAPATTAAPPPDASPAFRGLEAEFGARLGVFAVDTGTGRTLEHRADERFAYASTHKALSAALVLDRTTDAELDQVVPYDADDLVTHSPVTERHAGTGLPLRDLLQAAIGRSDNTAANLLLARLGGPAGFEAGLRELGDDVTQADRTEPELNEAVPGDERDTSTCRALASDLQAFLLGDALSADDRALLMEWMRGNTTGATLIEAGIPPGWEIADKSGAGGYGTRNDIAVLWPPDGAPIVLAVLSTRLLADAPHDDALVARAATVVVDTLQ